MKRILAVLVFALLASPVSAAAPQYKDAEYLQMVDKAMAAANPRAGIDWKTLRRLYQDTSFYHAPSQAPEIWRELEEKFSKISAQNPAALAEYKALLRVHFAHYRSHIEAATAAERPEGKFLDREYQKNAHYGIMDSILTAGDGMTAESAYPVIDTSEEYMIVRTVLKGKSTGQSLLPKNGHIYDILHYTDDAGKTHDAYFNIDVMFAKEDQEFHK